MSTGDGSLGSDERHGAQVASILLPFWLTTYAVFSFQGRLLEAPNAWVYPKRLATITLGTLLLWVAIRLQDRLRRRPAATRAAAAILVSLGGAATLLAFRVVYSLLAGEPSSLARDLRWVVTWIGYFLAWLSVAMTLALHPRGAGTARPAAPPVPAPAPPEPQPSPRAAIDDGLWVQRGQQLVRAPLETIDWVQAEGNYVRVHTSGGAGVLRASLSDIERRLAPHSFMRVHRSVLCRPDRIQALRRERSGALTATLDGGTEIPVGRRYGKPVIERIKGRIAAPG